jgi:hypothetical protein
MSPGAPPLIFHQSWVPHPCDVFVFVARVGDHRTQPASTGCARSRPPRRTRPGSARSSTRRSRPASCSNTRHPKPKSQTASALQRITLPERTLVNRRRTQLHPWECKPCRILETLPPPSRPVSTARHALWRPSPAIQTATATSRSPAPLLKKTQIHAVWLYRPT